MADEQEPGQRRREPKIEADLGLGGLLKGFGELIDLVGNLIEAGKDDDTSETSRTGSFEVKGSGGKVNGVYGFSVRTGIGGAPRVQRFGNLRRSSTGPVVAETREPLVDVFDEGSEMLVVVELPGVEESEIAVSVRDDIVSLETAGTRRYAREVLLPAPADPASLQQTYRNGILELRLRKEQASA